MEKFVTERLKILTPPDFAFPVSYYWAQDAANGRGKVTDDEKLALERAAALSRTHLTEAVDSIVMNRFAAGAFAGAAGMGLSPKQIVALSEDVLRHKPLRPSVEKAFLRLARDRERKQAGSDIHQDV